MASTPGPAAGHAASPPKTSPSNSTSAVRDEIVTSAVQFLQDPKTQSAAMSKKLAFLESKGLTQAEIDAAVAEHTRLSPAATTSSGAQRDAASATSYYGARSGTDAAGSAAGAPRPSMPPPMPPYPPGYGLPGPYGPTPDAHSGPYGPSLQSANAQAATVMSAYYRKRDYLLGGLATAGALYGFYHFVKEMVLPRLAWPTQVDIAEEREATDKQLTAVSDAVDGMRRDTLTLVDRLGGTSADVQGEIGELTRLLGELNQHEQSRQTVLTQLRDDLDELKQTVPHLVAKHRDAQNAMLSELQREMKSLKGLLARKSGAGAGVDALVAPSSATTASHPPASASPSASTASSVATAGPTGTANMSESGSSRGATANAGFQQQGSSTINDATPSPVPGEVPAETKGKAKAKVDIPEWQR
ncbi:hypothetical protein CXG81DRAFT_27291 [Caulochytrium protostelioides]|uniref:Peroxisomal membrane protein PEX14 n=1 Tax=Caulochytrium protostelioides TaxID=1555241 RepID=A0A4P9X4I5_9FUNG|nr:hypothetical protein CXG81DRAFT_27291 [Caulochytrium protostelioides]|eukprot:RKO99973.1 hypothetical protein CXG81DRAFT_27291 [Caulochytrium protostelioides]